MSAAPRGMIDVTGVPLEALVRAAYSPSRPQGLGYFHYQPGDLTDDEVRQIVSRSSGNGHTAVSMDYVKGRSVKFHVRRREGRLYIENRWYDHSDSELRNLLSGVGLSPSLLDAARAEQDAYEKECLAAATAFLKERGGRFEQQHPFSELPDEISIGLFIGQDRGAITSQWHDRTQVWTLAAE